MEETLYELISLIIGLIIGAAVARGFAYQRFKDILHKVRCCTEALDNAFADDKITKDEVKEIYEKCFKEIKQIIEKYFKKIGQSR